MFIQTIWQSKMLPLSESQTPLEPNPVSDESALPRSPSPHSAWQDFDINQKSETSLLYYIFCSLTSNMAFHHFLNSKLIINHHFSSKFLMNFLTLPFFDAVICFTTCKLVFICLFRGIFCGVACRTLVP